MKKKRIASVLLLLAVVLAAVAGIKTRLWALTP